MSRPNSQSRVGRPTREQSKRRHEELLDRVLELFVEYGYEYVTMEVIVESVGMTKRAIYVRYGDKNSLFRAAVQRAIAQSKMPLEALYAIPTNDLETALVEIARLRIANMLSPAGRRLQRIIGAEGFRFRDIFMLSYEESTRPTIEFIAELLQRSNMAGTTDIEEPRRAARVFMTMAVGGPSRLALLSDTMEPDELDDRICYAVHLFLNGALCRQTME